MRRAPRRQAAAVGILLCTALGAAGCTGDGDADSSGPTGAPATPSEAGAADTGVALEVSLGRVEGDLTPKAADRVSAEVGSVVDSWIDAAFGGAYPRTDFSTALDGFTGGAATQAEEQADLLTNADIGDRIEGVTFTQRRVVVDTVGRGKRAAGATARVRLTFETTGAEPSTVRVKGRLLLTPRQQTWKIFGFDVKKGER